VNCSVLPATTLAGFGVTEIDTSVGDEVLTVVLTVAELLPRFGSACAPPTLAVLVSVPAALGFTLMVIVELAPLASAPIAHVIVVVPEHPVPAVAVALSP